MFVSGMDRETCKGLGARQFVPLNIGHRHRHAYWGSERADRERAGTHAQFKCARVGTGQPRDVWLRWQCLAHRGREIDGWMGGCGMGWHGGTAGRDRTDGGPERMHHPNESIKEGVQSREPEVVGAKAARRAAGGATCCAVLC